MRRTLLTICASVLVLTAIGLVPVLSEDKKETAEAFNPFKAGDMHKVLHDHYVGDFTLTCKFWMDRKGEPMTSEGTATGEQLFGGRYVRQSFQVATKDGRMKLNGWSFHGYDTSNKQFIYAVIGDMGTGMDRYTGTYDEKANTITHQGQGYIEGYGNFSSRIVTHLTSKDEMKVEFFTTYTKVDEYKEMELIVTRKKP